jgi:PAS domain S-box-containing protein
VTQDAGRTVELRLRAAVESSPSGLLMIDDQGIIVLVNREVERLFGYAREELLGKPVELLVPARFRGGHPRFRSGFLRDPQARAMGAGRELFGLRKDGAEVPVEIGLTPVATEEGFFVISSIVDISARKSAEAAQRHLEEQLRQAQKMEAVGTLAGGIAHDFNNILGAIMGYAELAQGELGDRPGPAEDLADLLKAATRGKELIERMLVFSRRQEPSRRPLDLQQAVTEVRQLLRATIPAAIDIRLRASPTRPPRVAADATSVHQILMNLATNAAHAMPGGGVLEIGVEPFYARDSTARAHPGLREGTYVALTVRDTGLGMNRAVRDRAFEPFFTTKPPGSGSGLGLAIVHGIMRDHDGAVELESEPEQGTLVRCFFPALADEEDDAVAGAPPAPPGRGERVLYVDDEESLARVGVRRLQRLGYVGTAETDPLRALETFRARPQAFDLVITDYSMPQLAGLDLARAVRELRADIPIIMLTGFIEDLPPELIEQAGVNRVVKKPISMQDLGTILRDVLHPDEG